VLKIAAPSRTTPDRVYATPRIVTDLRDCYFYHTIDLPGYGLINGEWDLRAGIRAYLGNVDLRGKRVLEVGTANGFIGFHMEREGAEVVAYDLSEKQDWDVVPFAGYDHEAFAAARKAHIDKLNNAFWLGHRAMQSSSRVVYGDVYSIPSEIGPVDVSTFGSILLHLRDPFLALQRALRLTRETVIVTDGWGLSDLPDHLPFYRKLLPGPLRRPAMKFLPEWETCRSKETWWRLSPELVKQFLGVLGFGRTEVSYHTQGCGNGKGRLFTVVGHRTAGGPQVDGG
jgi:hypothetical protein